MKIDGSFQLPLPVYLLRELDFSSRRALACALFNLEPSAFQRPEGQPDEVYDENPDVPVPLNETQAKEIYSRCNEASRRVLLLIASSTDGHFSAAEVAQVLDRPAHTLSAVWSAITRATQAVTQIRSARLIDWYGAPVNGPDKVYIDQKCRVHQTAFEALRFLVLEE